MANNPKTSPPTPQEAALGAAVARLLKVMADLRGPDGCPWDKKQTHRSLIPYLVEEAHEVIGAIEAAQPEGAGQVAQTQDAHLAEELGDLLLQVVFHAQIGAERKAFDFAQVVEGLTAKLVERHPHVFGADPTQDEAELHRHWHRRKREKRSSWLEGIPASLPALFRALKVSGAAAKAGFDWRATAEILDKAQEEVLEFRQEVERLEGLAKGQKSPQAAQEEEAQTEVDQVRQAMEMELGDLLFALVQMARWHKIDPESALRRSTDKFIARFTHMERALLAQGRREAPPEDWEPLWEAAKQSIPR